MSEDKIDGVVTVQTWFNLSNKFNDEIEQLQKSLTVHEQGYDKHFLNIEKVLELAQTAHRQYEKKTDLGKRLLLDNLLSNVIVEGEKFTPIYRQPFDILAGMVQ